MLRSLSSNERLAGMGIFLLLAAETAVNLLGDIQVFVIPVLWAIAIALFFLGLSRRLPRWFMPFMGLVYGLFVYYTAHLLVGAVLTSLLLPLFRSNNLRDRLLSQALAAGFFWIGLVGLTALILFFMQRQRPADPFYQRLREDWTLLSFLFYGAGLLPLLFVFDEFQQVAFYLVAAFLSMAFGAGGYLSARLPANRLVWLMAGLALAGCASAVGTWLLLPLQDWPEWFRWQPPEVERNVQTVRALASAGWGWLALLAPAWLLSGGKHTPSIS